MCSLSGGICPFAVSIIMPILLLTNFQHMLFMGSEKYPDENHYDSFVTVHGTKLLDVLFYNAPMFCLSKVVVATPLPKANIRATNLKSMRLSSLKL